MKSSPLIVLLCALVFAVVGLTLAAMVYPDNTPKRPSWEGADGIVDMSEYPAIRKVIDRTGAVVGEVETQYLGTSEKIPVYQDGELVGHFGPNGFWALGEAEPVIEGKETTIEEYSDPDSNEPTRIRRK